MPLCLAIHRCSVPLGAANPASRLVTKLSLWIGFLASWKWIFKLSSLLWSLWPNWILSPFVAAGGLRPVSSLFQFIQNLVLLDLRSKGSLACLCIHPSWAQLPWGKLGRISLLERSLLRRRSSLSSFLSGGRQFLSYFNPRMQKP